MTCMPLSTYMVKPVTAPASGETRKAARRVRGAVVDADLDERLLRALLADRARGAALQRAGRDGVDPDAVLAARLEGQHARVALELRLGTAHATAVARDHLQAKDMC
eukprot:scaffold73378_cov63-Phaeocystis_antarctica.AAC.5